MTTSLAMIHETAAFLRKAGFDQPTIGIVMGTGLGEMASQIENPIVIPYPGIPHFPEATVEFHKGNLIYGSIGSVKVIAMQGRFHYYEGYSMQQITFPVRVMKELGVKQLLLSNAAGGMNPDFKKGDLVITEDHLNFLPDNPLRGLSNEFGNRFTDMSEPYSPSLRKKIELAFQQVNLIAKKGIYVSVMGPNLETKAEYRWLRNCDADMVGMSTVPEVIVANQVGIECAAISVITDECDPDNLKPVNIPEIIAIAGEADKKLTKVLCRFMGQEK
jgi:purine-nucleoside phosphorylase